MATTRSLRLHFDNRDPNDLKLMEEVPSVSLPRVSDDLGNRNQITGCWIQLEGPNGEVLYLKDLPGLMTPLSEESENEEMPVFFALVPYLPNATTVAVFAPPRARNGPRPLMGAPSVLVKRFPFPLAEERPEAGVVPPSDICGSGRGQVLSVTTVVYHGTIENIYNFVILADKFGSSDQASFDKYASNCINYLLSRPPFTSVFGSDAVNIFFVQVSSNAADPSYFNSTYSSGSTLINWDTLCVCKVCDALFSVGGKPY